MKRSPQVHVIRFRATFQRCIWFVAFGSLLVWGAVNVVEAFWGRAIAALEPNVDGLQEATRWLPDDAEIHRDLGLIFLLDPVHFDAQQALVHFNKAVRLQPCGYMTWLDRGRAFEQLGDEQEAEQSYRKAMALAPAYFRPRWMYANFLLRTDREDEGLTELARLAEVDPDAARSIFDLIRQAGEASGQPLMKRFSPLLASDERQSDLVRYLVSQGHVQDALESWDQIPLSSPQKSQSGLLVIPPLVNGGQWASAASVWRETLKSRFEDYSVEESRFWNPSFDRDLLPGGFDWIIAGSQGVSVSLDPESAGEGRRSLMIQFSEGEGTEWSGVHHDILLSPDRDYRLTFFYKTEDMLARNGVVLEILTIGTPVQSMAVAAPFLNPTDWTQVSLRFQTPPTAALARIQIGRRPVGHLHDYISGKIWFDDFSLSAVRP